MSFSFDQVAMVVMALWAIAGAGVAGVVVLGRILWNHHDRLLTLEWVTGLKRKEH